MSGVDDLDNTLAIAGCLFVVAFGMFLAFLIVLVILTG